MRRSLTLLLCVPAALFGQATGLDDGRLDPAWFGAGVALQPSRALGFQWLKPGLDLRGRTLRLKGWEPAAWLLGKRGTQDQFFLTRVEARLEPSLAAGLQRGLKGTVPVSPVLGDVVLLGRVADAVGESGDYMASGAVSLSFDLKLLDGDTGELLGAFHDTLKGPNADAIPLQLARWSEDLGRLLAPSTIPTIAKPVPVPTKPVFDLEGALRRIEGLVRDGLLTDEESQALRKKATEKAAGQGK